VEQRDADAALMVPRSQRAPIAKMQAVRRLAFVVPSAETAHQYFGPVFDAITAQGHKVLCLTPAGLSQAADAPGSAPQGIEMATFDVKPEGWSFLQQRRAVQGLLGTLKDWAAHSVVAAGGNLLPLAFQAAAGSGAAHLIAVFDETGTGIRGHDTAEWRTAVAMAGSSVFFNSGDRIAALKTGLIGKSQPACVVPAAGCDLAVSSTLPLPPFDGDLAVLMHAPLPAPRQPDAMLDAAVALTRAHPRVRVVLTGRTPVAGQQVAAGVSIAGDEPSVDHSSSLRAHLAGCHVYVHGPDTSALPANLMEALAAGRPVIALDGAAGRDLVDELINGCLVPQATPALIEQAVSLFVNQPDLIAAAARASRFKAERWLDRREATKAWLAALSLTA